GQHFSNNEMESSRVGKMFIRRKRQSQPPLECPSHFKLQNTSQFCYVITKSDTWRNVYGDCFQNGIEKTPLDDKDYWSNKEFIDELINKENITSIWLAVERKIGGGPFYYSGPVGSDFNYNDYSATDDFNITWKTRDFNIREKCIFLNLVERSLNTVSCEEHFPFICIFPSEFHTHNIIYDSFETDSSEEPWIEARSMCKKSNMYYELVNTESEIYKTHITNEEYDEYSGNQNSYLQIGNQSDAFRKWIKFPINTSNLFVIFETGFMTQSSNISTFACMPLTVHPKLEIKQNKYKISEFTVSTVNVNEISYIYDIKCYLNGKLVEKEDHSPVINIYQQGNLFCEALTHMPIKLISSDILPIYFPNVIYFTCEIYVKEKYSFQLHDLTFQSEQDGGVIYYERLLKNKLQKCNVTILNITQSTDKSGINIEFFLEVHAEENETLDIYHRIHALLQSNDSHWESKNVNVNYIRNTKYCLSDIMYLNKTEGCISNIIWPNTLLNDMYECIECNKPYRRHCSGTLLTGGKWEPPIVSIYSQNVPLCDHNVDDAFSTLLNITANATSSITNPTTLSTMAESVTEAIVKFENILVEHEVNATKCTGNSCVIAYSSSIDKNVGGYYGTKSAIIKKLHNTEIFETGEDIDDATAIVHLKLKNNNIEERNNKILLALFENSSLFPIDTINFSKLSPVFLIKIPNLESISFPIHISHSIEHEDNLNVTDMVPVCGFWNETTHKWEKNEVDKYEGKTKYGLYKCSHNHLTCFALLVHADNKEHEAILDVVTLIGCYLSLIGLGLIIIAFILLRRWRDKSHDIKILFSLSLSLFVMYLLFLIGINQSSIKGLCIAFGASLHYFILTSFCWMLVVAYHNYLKFYRVIGIYIPQFMLKASFSAWITPVIPVIIIVSINPELYADKKFCWVHSEAFYYGFLVPVCLIWLLNLIVFVKILCNICVRQIQTNRAGQQSLIVSQVVLSLFLFVILGLSWIFGFFAAAQSNVIFNYLFCFTTTTQGFLMFLFFALLEKKAKDKYIKMVYPCFKKRGKVPDESRSRKTSATELTQKSSAISFSQE
ncbi:hypothetical protein L9F63_020349, partial [Diploptera punctata]